MSNQLKMDTVHAIYTLDAQGWSQRKIARELGIHRSTVARHLGSKPAKVPTGSEVGSEPPTEALAQPENRPAEPRSRSECEPYRAVIEGKLQQGLSAQRIYQDLQVECNDPPGYDSVKRYVRALRASSPLPFRRVECGPGEEAQIDFGQAAPVVGPDGKRRRPHVLRVVLSYSRKGYSEAVDRQTTENFIRAIENAFRHFGGCPQTLVIDNLKAAVKKADWFDPDLNPKVQSFAAHYGTVFLPTRPRTPRHKGKVERGVDYVQENALRGKTFGSLAEQNEYLADWERNVADTRIHGTTRKHVGRDFQEHERGALEPLSADAFPFFHEESRTVHRDGHISLEKAFYSVPPEYLSRKVWVRWDSRRVRIFNAQMDQIALHVKAEPGQFRTHDGHLPTEKRSGVEKGATWWLTRVSLIGTHASEWAAAMLKVRGVAGIRVLIGLKQLASAHSHESIDEACRVALGYGVYRLRTLRELLKHKAPAQQKQFDFLDEHPVIRPLQSYSDFMQSVLRKE